MRVDAFALRLRPRTVMEAADLGVRLCQISARSIYPCYVVAALPVIGIAIATFSVTSWLPALFLWWAKPWLDRTILFVLSRAAFGQTTTLRDLWQQQRNVWWRQFFVTWTLRRLSPWRSLTQPVYQLEGLSLRKARQRVRLIRRGKAGAASLVTGAFSLTETILWIGTYSLLYWLAPPGMGPGFLEILSNSDTPTFAAFNIAAYILVVLFLEPFYVAAGFAIYLTRRAELEAWDIEQEFRRAFPR